MAKLAIQAIDTLQAYGPSPLSSIIGYSKGIFAGIGQNETTPDCDVQSQEGPFLIIEVSHGWTTGSARIPLPTWAPSFDVAQQALKLAKKGAYYGLYNIQSGKLVNSQSKMGHEVLTMMNVAFQNFKQWEESVLERCRLEANQHEEQLREKIDELREKVDELRAQSESPSEHLQNFQNKYESKEIERVKTFAALENRLMKEIGAKMERMRREEKASQRNLGDRVTALENASPESEHSGANSQTSAMRKPGKLSVMECPSKPLVQVGKICDFEHDLPKSTSHKPVPSRRAGESVGELRQAPSSEKHPQVSSKEADLVSAKPAAGFEKVSTLPSPANDTLLEACQQFLPNIGSSCGVNILAGEMEPTEGCVVEADNFREFEGN